LMKWAYIFNVKSEKCSSESMLIRLNTKIDHIVKHPCLMFQKNLSNRS